MTNRSPQLIGCCDGEAWAARAANASRSCSNNATRSPCWGTIRHNQAALVNGGREPDQERESASTTSQELDSFLNSLRLLWQRSEPAKRGGWQAPTRTYRTRADPTLSCWHLVLEWLLADPLLTGQQAMQRLDREQPGLYGGSLRTLQRRMTDWRVANA